MKPRLISALAREPLARPPVWVMRQAGRHLPEYRELRHRHSFQEVVTTPKLAAEVTLQPVRRYGMDGAVIFADIMTPLEAMGVDVSFDPGPKLEPLSLAEIISLPDLEPDLVDHVSETIRIVRSELEEETAVIGFAGAPITLLAYLLEGGGSKEFMSMRTVIRSEPERAAVALDKLAGAMNAYLRAQTEAGADVVQLFDTWAVLCDRDTYSALAAPAARASLAGVDAPSIYFAPGAGHTLDLQGAVGATGYGADWRTPIGEAFDALPGHAIQGNLDPAVLRTGPETIRREVGKVLAAVGGRPGHVMNLGHGIDRRTPPENVAVFVDAVRS